MRTCSENRKNPHDVSRSVLLYLDPSGGVMSLLLGTYAIFGSPIFTIHVLPKALLTKVVELKNRALRRPKLEEKSVEFFIKGSAGRNPKAKPP